MILFIEAAAIRTGGGLTYVRSLIQNAVPMNFGFHTVHIFAPAATLDALPDYPWLHKRITVHLDEGLLARMYWLNFIFPRILRAEGPSVLLLTSAAAVKYKSTVSVCQNLLPFQERERFRYPFKDRIRLHLLRRSQMNSFQMAGRVIHMTEYAKNVLAGIEPSLEAKSVVIPHGIDDAFRKSVRRYSFTPNKTVRLLYVSIIDVYKHQDKVVEAVALLRKAGHNIELVLAGPAYGPSLAVVKNAIAACKVEKWVDYKGACTAAELVKLYHEADLFVFASSCETFGIILLEAMAQGLPIACSNKSSLPETLGDAGLYFDPDIPQSIADSIGHLLADEGERKRLGEAAAQRAENYTWQKTATKTYEVLNQTAIEMQSVL